MLTLRAGHAVLSVDPGAGGRLTALAVDGLDLLRTRDDDREHFGCFPMAPWAGRTGGATFTFAGTTYELPANNGPHAIHGTVRDLPWTVEDANPLRAHLSCALGPAWPFAGHAEQVITLFADRLELELSVHATDEPMPAIVGWHPWFSRGIALGDAGVAVVDAGAMLERGPDHLPTGRLVSPPPPGPWDDCFVDLRSPPRVEWRGALTLAIESDCPCVVVYDEPEDAICVEPQSAPPDALRHDPPVATPGHPVVAHSTWCWS